MATAADSKRTFEIITVEYPPYLTQFTDDKGIAFAHLNKWLLRSNLRLDPVLRFLPPARAQKALHDEQWCASFYPPKDRNSAPFVSILNRQIRIKLARRHEASVFEWLDLEEFSERSIAVLRPIQESPLFRDFEDNGAVLVYVDSIDQAMQMLIRKRVDFAMIDELKFETEYQTLENGRKLQLSTNTLEATSVGFFIGPACLHHFQKFVQN